MPRFMSASRASELMYTGAKIMEMGPDIRFQQLHYAADFLSIRCIRSPGDPPPDEFFGKINSSFPDVEVAHHGAGSSCAFRLPDSWATNISIVSMDLPGGLFEKQDKRSLDACRLLASELGELSLAVVQRVNVRFNTQAAPIPKASIEIFQVADFGFGGYSEVESSIGVLLLGDATHTITTTRRSLQY